MVLRIVMLEMRGVCFVGCKIFFFAEAKSLLVQGVMQENNILESWREETASNNHVGGAFSKLEI